jgi:hypothetical protein
VGELYGLHNAVWRLPYGQYVLKRAAEMCLQNVDEALISDVTTECVLINNCYATQSTNVVMAVMKRNHSAVRPSVS